MHQPIQRAYEADVPTGSLANLESLRVIGFTMVMDTVRSTCIDSTHKLYWDAPATVKGLIGNTWLTGVLESIPFSELVYQSRVYCSFHHFEEIRGQPIASKFGLTPWGPRTSSLRAERAVLVEATGHTEVGQGFTNSASGRGVGMIQAGGRWPSRELDAGDSTDSQRVPVILLSNNLFPLAGARFTTAPR
jgi:hypothetical protein